MISDPRPAWTTGELCGVALIGLAAWTALMSVVMWSVALVVCALVILIAGMTVLGVAAAVNADADHDGWATLQITSAAPATSRVVSIPITACACSRHFTCDEHSDSGGAA